MDPIEDDYEFHHDIAQPPKVHVCSMCDAHFNRKSHLTRHMRSHTNDRPHRCETCFSHFTRSDLLRRHEKVCDEGGIRSKRKACQACADSKAKCSQTQPCTRCASRGKTCEYFNTSTDCGRKGPGRTLAPFSSQSSPASSPMSSPTATTFMPPFDYALNAQGNMYYGASNHFQNPPSFDHPQYNEEIWPRSSVAAEPGWGQSVEDTYNRTVSGGLPFPVNQPSHQFNGNMRQMSQVQVSPEPMMSHPIGPGAYPASPPYPNFQQYPNQNARVWY